MSTIATTNFKTLSAKSFIGNVQNDEHSVYAFFGRSHPWANEDLGASPSVPQDYQLDYYSADRDIIALKKINPADVCHVIPRKNWTPYKVYEQWDDRDDAIWEKDFYVMNSDYVVYKCLRTPINRSTGEKIQSTVEPTHVPTYDAFGSIDLSDDPKQYDDGYIWKFMYKLSELDMKFLTFDYVPVRHYDSTESYLSLTTTEQLNADVQEASSSLVGKIYAYVVSNSDSGTGYTTGDEPTIVITGDGSGASATAYVASNNSISTVEVDEDTDGSITGSGSNYHQVTVTVDDSASSGTGGTVRAIVSPNGGHGTNPVEELGAYFVGINAEFRNSTTTDSDIQINTKYRQIGLLENPQIDVSTANSADGLNGNITLNVSLEPLVSSIDNLQYLYDAAGDSPIAWIDGVETVTTDTTGDLVRMRVHRTEDTKYVDFDSSSVADLYLENDTLLGSIVSSVESEYVHYSGNILFLENRLPVERNPSQVEQIKFVVEF
jgi:hypothetical protein